MSLPDLNVVDVYSVNKNHARGLMVIVKPTFEMLQEDIVGVSVNFAMPSGQVLEAQIEKVFGFEDNLHLFFPNLTKIFKPIGFSDPNEPQTVSFDTNSIA